MNVLLRKALETKEPTMMIYIDKEEKISQRIIRVESIVGDKIKAYCFWRKQSRTFCMQNILSIGPAKRKKIGA